MNHIYKSEWRKEKDRAQKKALIVSIFTTAILIACFLIASYFDHKALMAGLIS
jgi:hypothetical protein